MSDTQLNVSVSDLRKEIITWLKTQLDSDGFQWISNQHKEISEGAEDWQFFSSFSAVPRHTGKEKLKLSPKQLDKADTIRSGWRPDILRVDQLGRILLVLSIAEIGREEFLDKLEKTFVSADMGESVALYYALPILPYPEKLTDRAAEGIRSNMTSVFNAVALNNPYPSEYFDEGPWNQLVLKALFVQSPLFQIQGLDKRVNSKLANMLVDYAHERWAAGRTVTPELWRPVGPFAKGAMIEDLKKVLADEDPLQKQAAMLALSASDNEKANALVEEHQQLLDEINSKNIDWNDIGERAEKYR